MTFSKYNSISNHYREVEIENIKGLGFDKLEWVATEKVHGANLSFWPSSDGVRVASRSGLTDDGFYGGKSVFDAIRPKVQELGMVVYGELFGDGVQKGIRYGEKRFAAFDIHDGERYVDYHSFVRMCDKYYIPRCTVLAIGDFYDLLSMSQEFPTTMSDSGDLAEGFVMKPVTDVYFNNGSRVILKKKSQKFSEKDSCKKEKVVVELSDSQQHLFNLACQLINTNRVDCARSKGEDDFGKILRLIIDDIKDELSEVDLSEWDSIKKNVTAEVVTVIKGVLFSE